MTYKAKWSMLEAKCEGNLKAGLAIMAAEQNAADTIRENPNKTFNFHRLAYDSLCMTSLFQEDEELEKFFMMKGYVF